MPDNLIYITPAQKEFSGSSFALWRLLKFNHLEAERISIGEKQFIWVRLPVTEAEIPHLSARNSRLLLCRLESLVGRWSLCLLAPPLRTLSFFAPLHPCEPSHDEVFSLTSGFLPEILSCMHRQWGLSFENASVALLRSDRPFLPIAKAVAPYAHCLTLLGAAPPYHEQDAAWEAWGLAVCHEEKVPSDCALLITDASSPPPTLPKGTPILLLSGDAPGAISPSHIYFRLPGALSSLTAPLGGVTADILPLLLRVFYEEHTSWEAARRAGFSVSRIALSNGKNYS